MTTLAARTQDSPETTQRLGRLDAVIEQSIAPEAVVVDSSSRFPTAGIKALADADLGGLLMPRELGGQECSMEVYGEAVARIAAACGATSTVYMTQMHCAHPLRLQANEEQQRRWIPRLCSGEAIGAIALTEPEAGSDVASMRTTARLDGDHYVVNGSKIFISNGDVADVIVLFASVDAALGKDGITAFVVETANLTGLTAGQPMKKLGQKGASTVELTFEECRIPQSARIGAVGEGYPLLLQSVLTSRISAAAQGVGFAAGAFDATVAHLDGLGLLSSKNREAQDIQFELARIRAAIVAGRAMLHDAAQVVDIGEGDPTPAVSMAKMHCTTLGMEVATRCLELLGPEADSVELGVERRFRDAKIAEIYDGTNQVQSMLVARDLRLTSVAG